MRTDITIEQYIAGKILTARNPNKVREVVEWVKDIAKNGLPDINQIKLEMIEQEISKNSSDKKDLTVKKTEIKEQIKREAELSKEAAKFLQ